MAEAWLVSELSTDLPASSHHVSLGLALRASMDQVNAFMELLGQLCQHPPGDQQDASRTLNLPEASFHERSPICFPHHDLAPRDIILDHEGQLWLIDWNIAGFRPKFFEYAGMHNPFPLGGPVG